MNKLLFTFMMLLAVGGWSEGQPSREKPLTEADLASPPSGGQSGDLVQGQIEYRGAPDRSGSAAEKTSSTNLDATPRKRGNGTTEITARESDFDQKAHQAVFLTEVVVVNPEFHLTCDKLTAYLKEEGQPKTDPDANAEPEAKGGGLERAIAEGHVVIIQDKTQDGGAVTRNTGRAKMAVYESSSGDLTLTGWPEVQTGINLCVALAEETKMVLYRNGRMAVDGPNKVVIKDAATKPAARVR